MKLVINNFTVAAEGLQWFDDNGYGTAKAANTVVRYTCDANDSANYDPFYCGVIKSEDIALLPSGYLENLTRKCAQCGNAIDAEEQFCDDCLNNATPGDSEAGSLDSYREPLSVRIAEEAQREYDPVFNSESECDIE